jgi:hypothetical protein
MIFAHVRCSCGAGVTARDVSTAPAGLDSCDDDRMRCVGVVIASVALLVSRTDRARACTCPSNGFDLPANGAIGVPTNLREIYFSSQDASDGVLRSEDGEELDVGLVRAAGYGASMFVASVPAELRPNMRYELRSAQPASVLLAFTTGGGPDLVAPPAPRFERFHIDYIGTDGDSCGRVTAEINGYVAAPRDADIATAVVRFVRSNGESEERILPTAPTGRLIQTGETVWVPSILGSLVCQVQLELLEDEPYLVEAWTIDVAGNASEVTKQDVLVERGGCAATRPGSLGCGLVVLALASRRRRRPA